VDPATIGAIIGFLGSGSGGGDAAALEQQRLELERQKLEQQRQLMIGGAALAGVVIVLVILS